MQKNLPLKSSLADFVQETLIHCATQGASDIHFEPSFNELKIRYRKDGFFYNLSPLPLILSDKVLAHIKSIAHLNVAERNKPQDGRISLQNHTSKNLLNFRVSTIPAQFGETLVLRVLNDASRNLTLDQLGMDFQLIENVRKLAHLPHGLFIVTGPTGSGKTTTLYSLLQDIYSPNKKYLTVEDPVEYILPGISQIAINTGIGLTFSKVLRAFLRHDPDVIMIGEIRDLETAQIAIQASLTGHLVFTTLHTNNAASAVIRLLDLGIPSSLLASSLQCILAQRLIPKPCIHCHKNSIFPCPQCNNSGYQGRTGQFELMSISPTLRQIISKNNSVQIIESQAISEGMISLGNARYS
ncbi:MAG: hypothetical protein C5B43_03770 [Verrucomicrobia bacterium]|nr:MAG: hypothetical protein C5B43_03770 [Verrucomicrobiota bacterium]